MSSIRRRTIDLPDRVTVTILRLPDRLSVQILRSMMNAELYVLAGATASPSGECTGFGAYVGTSGALGQMMARSGVSLRQWAFRSGRLRPQVVVLINRPGRPMAPAARLLVEASLVRAISRRYTVLNTNSSAPTAALAATRSQRLWAMHTAQRLAGVVMEQVFLPHPAAAQGGTMRERLVRLVLDQRPPRALDTQQILRLAADAGIDIAGESPAQRTRRDCTTREHQGATGRPRLLRTHVQGRAVIYPAGAMTLRQARADYTAGHRGAPPRMPCQARGPATRVTGSGPSTSGQVGADTATGARSSHRPAQATGAATYPSRLVASLSK